jgi:hypothetical protein
MNIDIQEVSFEAGADRAGTRILPTIKEKAVRIGVLIWALLTKKLKEEV